MKEQKNRKLADISMQVMADLVAINYGAKRCGVKSEQERAPNRTLGNTNGYSEWCLKLDLLVPVSEVGKIHSERAILTSRPNDSSAKPFSHTNHPTKCPQSYFKVED